jgi:hypothetical protein
MHRSLLAVPPSNSSLVTNTSNSHEQPRPTSRDAIPIQHLLDPDDIVGSFPIRDDQKSSYLGEREDCSETSHWSEDYDRYDVFVGAAIPDYDDVKFESFFGACETLNSGSYPLNADLGNISGTGGSCLAQH